MTDDEDSSHAHAQWVRSLAEARQNAREQKYHLERGGRVDPTDCIGAGKTHREFHAAILDYHDHVAALVDAKDGARELWEKTITRADMLRAEGQDETELQEQPVTVPLPVQSGGDVVFRDQPLKLYGFDEVFGLRTVEFKQEVFDARRGRVEKTVSRKVWMPPKAGAAAYRMLDRVVEELGLAAYIETELPTFGFVELDEEHADDPTEEDLPVIGFDDDQDKGADA